MSIEHGIERGFQFMESLAGGLLDMVFGRGGDGVPYSSAETAYQSHTADNPDIHIHGQVLMHEDAARSAEEARISEAHSTQEQYNANMAADEHLYAARKAEEEQFAQQKAAFNRATQEEDNGISLGR